jgi:hypothetical protein
VRLVEIGNEDMRLVLAMNRVRHGYLTIAPGLQPYFSTGHHDDQQGLRASLLVAGPHDLHPWVHFLITAPTLVATVDAAIATVVVVLLVQATAAAPVAVVAAGAVTFLVVWGAPFSLNARTARTLRATTPRFPTSAQGRLKQSARSPLILQRSPPADLGSRLRPVPVDAAAGPVARPASAAGKQPPQARPTCRPGLPRRG